MLAASPAAPLATWPRQRASVAPASHGTTPPWKAYLRDAAELRSELLEFSWS